MGAILKPYSLDLGTHTAAVVFSVDLDCEFSPTDCDGIPDFDFPFRTEFAIVDFD